MPVNKEMFNEDRKLKKFYKRMMSDIKSFGDEESKGGGSDQESHLLKSILEVEDIKEEADQIKFQNLSVDDRLKILAEKVKAHEMIRKSLSTEILWGKLSFIKVSTEILYCIIKCGYKLFKSNDITQLC